MSSSSVLFHEFVISCQSLIPLPVFDSPAILQVDFMTTQMCEMQHEVDDKQKTETALKAAEQARKQV